MLASYLRVGVCRGEKCFSLVPPCGWVFGVKCVSLVPACGWVSGREMCYPHSCVLVGVGGRNVLASYLRVGGCLEEKCVSLVTVCGWVWGGEMCEPRTYVCGCREEKRVILVRACVGVGRRNV